jgi:hypothetical protein
MSTIKATINPDASLTVVKTDDAGGAASWDITPEQVKKHLLGIDNPAHTFNGLSKGDKSAALDAAAQSAKDEK